MKLSIIILNYNTKDLLEKCLQSINTNPGWEIIVVDNASSDDSSKMVKDKFPQVQLIQNQKNLGFAAGNNVGIKQAKGEYVLLLNSDTQVINDSLEKMITYMDRHPDVAAVTPKVLLPDGAIDLACHRGMPTPWNAFTYFSKLETLFPTSKLFAGYHQTYKDFNTTHQVEATAMTAMMLRNEVLKELGPLDERFFFYAEDLDYCYRINKAGYKIVYYPHAVVMHYKSQSGKKNKKDEKAKDEATIYFYDTMKQFYQKHYQDSYPKWLQRMVYKAIDLKKRWSMKK